MRRLALPLLAVAVLSCACVGPTRDYSGYAGKARHSAESAGSAVETTLLAIREALQDKATGPELSVLVRDAEDDVSTAQSTFTSVQPPDDRSDRLRGRVNSLLSAASSAVSQARIAVRRGDTKTLVHLRGALRQLSSKLDALSRELLP